MLSGKRFFYQNVRQDSGFEYFLEAALSCRGGLQLIVLPVNITSQGELPCSCLFCGEEASPQSQDRAESCAIEEIPTDPSSLVNMETNSLLKHSLLSNNRVDRAL